MFVFRTAWIVKPGCMAQARTMLDRALNENIRHPFPVAVTCRVLWSDAAPDTLVFEEGWPDAQTHDAWWEADNKTPENKAFFEEWNKLVARMVPTEVWQEAEWKYAAPL